MSMRPCSLQVHAAILDACSRASASLDGSGGVLLGVTSSIRGEGRTSIATAMALAQARDFSRSTILIDADFEGPCIARQLGLPPTPGVGDVVHGELSLDEAVLDLGGGLSVLTAGLVDSPPALASKLVESKILQDLQTEYESVVVDLPAIVGSPCGRVLARLFTQPLLVIRAGATSARMVRAAVDQLDHEPTAFLNGTRTSLPRWMSRFLE